MGKVSVETQDFQVDTRFTAVKYGLTADKKEMGFFFLDTTDSVVEFIPITKATNRIFKMFYDTHKIIRGVSYVKEDTDASEFEGSIAFDSNSRLSKDEILVLSRGLETVTGVHLFDIEEQTQCCRRYTGNSDVVRIPFGVKSIAFNATACNCKVLYIPASVTHVDISSIPDLETLVCDSAVSFVNICNPNVDNGFPNLKRVVFLDSFSTNAGQTICDGTFVENQNLEYVRIGSNVSKIEHHCFTELPKLRQVDFGDLDASALSDIDALSFANCPLLTQLDLPSSLEHFWVTDARGFCIFHKMYNDNVCMGSGVKKYSFGVTLLRNIVKLSKSKAIYNKLGKKVTPAHVMSFFIPKSAETVTIRHRGYDTSKVTLSLIDLPNLKFLRVPSYVVVDDSLLQSVGQTIKIEHYAVD